MKQVELILNSILLALQACLGIWQLMVLTLVGPLLQGLVGWLLPGLPQSPTYFRLQHCKGRIFKKANCFVLQAHTPSQRKVIKAADKFGTIRVWYLGKRFLLEKSGSEQNMLFINGKMCYYITPRIWEELLHLGEETLLLDVPGPSGAATVDACVDEASTVVAARVAMAPRYSTAVFVKGYKQCLKHECWKEVMRSGVMTFEEVVDVGI